MSKKTIRVELSVDFVSLGKAMRAWREDVGLTQREAAELIGLSNGWWSVIEGGMSCESKRGEGTSLRVLLDIINLIHEDDSPQAAFSYFAFV